jgi:phosphoserine phosphatase SerB
MTGFSEKWVIFILNIRSVNLETVQHALSNQPVISIECTESFIKIILSSSVPLQTAENLKVTLCQWYSDFVSTIKNHSKITSVVCVPYLRFITPKKLAVFDMDSTLIKQEVVDEIAAILNVKDQISKITHRAMNGELDFKDSLRQRVALFKGSKVSDIYKKICQIIEFNVGVKETVQNLKERNVHLVVISGGFLPFARFVKDMLGLDEAYANILEEEDGVWTGHVEGETIDGVKKKEIVDEIARRMGISTEEIVAIGDGANVRSLTIRFHLRIFICCMQVVWESLLMPNHLFKRM